MGTKCYSTTETWSYKKPLIYNNRFEDDVTSGTALVGDIKKAYYIANSINKILNNRYNKNFIIKGYNKLQIVKKIVKKLYKFK